MWRKGRPYPSPCHILKRALIRLRHKSNGLQHMRRFPAKVANPSIPQTPRHCWVSEICDAVVIAQQPENATFLTLGLVKFALAPTSGCRGGTGRADRRWRGAG